MYIKIKKYNYVILHIEHICQYPKSLIYKKICNPHPGKMQPVKAAGIEEKRSLNASMSKSELETIILGAIVTTLENLDYNESEIDDIIYECKRGTFVLYNKEQLLQAGQKAVN